MPKLNQVLAIEKGVKSRTYGEFTEIYKAMKPDLFTGFAKTYRPKDADAEVYPPENLRVRVSAKESLERVSTLLTELFDTTATKDWANCQAKGTIAVDGRTLLADVPVTYLLFLEKQLTDMRTFIEAIPTLDPTFDWTFDGATSIWKTPVVSTTKTKKVQRPIVKYDAVVRDGVGLPAQTEMITEDQVIGTWETINHSGALPVSEKRRVAGRVEKLLQAVKYAREEANGTAAEKKEVGRTIFEYLFGN